MSVPAIGGTVVPDRIFRGNIDLPIETIVEFFEAVLKGEHNLARAFEGDNVDKLNSIIKGAAPAVVPYVLEQLVVAMLNRSL